MPDENGPLNQRKATERFYSLVWPHRAAVLRTALFLTHDAAEAEDLAQETLIKAFRFISAFQDGTDMKAWLMTILRNTRTDRLRATAAEAGNVSLDRLYAEPADTGEEFDAPWAWQDPEQVLNGFADQQIIDALLELPEELRWTLLLVDVEQVDHKDAARILGIPVGTVKSRAHRGRVLLRRALLPIAKQMRLIR
ncbi:MAG: sigma-70 family RNA polymerase sigma factor [Bacillota bacterium]